MPLHIHQTHHIIADFNSIFDYLKTTLTEQKRGLHVFPELYLTGYPLQDLCLQQSFIEKYQAFLLKINTFSQSLPDNDKCVLLLGGLYYSQDASVANPLIENVIYRLEAGKKLEKVYTKQLLPSYDIFDEAKYFQAGNQSVVIECLGKKVGLLICEDMWHSPLYEMDPVNDLATKTKADNIQLDLLVNLSASPFSLHKSDQRYARAKQISHQLAAPMLYVNRVGAEDEVIFDGCSFAVNGEETVVIAKRFRADALSLSLPIYSGTMKSSHFENVDSDFGKLFTPELYYPQTGLPTLLPLEDEKCARIVAGIQFAVQEYMTKNGFNKLLVALSGGMDSALVVTLLKLSLKDNQSLECIYMPSEFSREISEQLSVELCQNLDIPLYILPITPLHHLARQVFTSAIGEALQGLSDENIQSRLRGLLLLTRSNQSNALVINTSNKSELAVGYSTIYGDSVGGLSIIGDLYKSEIYRLADYINETYNKLIPNAIITRPPSAELRVDQVDTDSLPPYERLDVILEGILSYSYTLADLIELGFAREEVEKVARLYQRSEYKRTQFCPIVKIKAKSFGFGYRVPISKQPIF